VPVPFADVRSTQPIVALVAGVAVALAACGLVQPEPDRSVDAGADAAGPRDAGSEPKPCVPPARPSRIPSSWVEYTDFAPCAGIYFPPSPSELPADLQWLPCLPTTDPLGCERLSEPVGPPWSGFGAMVLGDYPYFVVGRGAKDGSEVVLVDALGKARAAVSSASNWFVRVPLSGAAGGGWYLVEVIHHYGTGLGYLVGALGDVHPRGSRRWGNPDYGEEDTTQRWFAVGTPGVMHRLWGTSIEILDPITGQKRADVWKLSASGDDVRNADCNFQGPALFCTTDTPRFVRRWTKAAGNVDFIVPSDPTRSAGTLATDGKDMVWIEGFGPIVSSFHESAEYVTSPHVEDKSLLAPRRLRSEESRALNLGRITVGCGRAALQTTTGLRVVRIADGASWFLGSQPYAPQWLEPLALTCEHLYARRSYQGNSYLARVPLAKLGAATPPD
jgi:hypothetical protein